MILETQRLYLREITVEDAESAYLLNLDPEVLQYTGDEPFESVEAARNFLNAYDHYKTYGFGRWGVIARTNNEFLGWCGLKYTPFLREHDIGFRFFKKHWNKGYATEAALACLDIGFQTFGISTIVGRVMPQNGASQKVLTKIGLEFSGERITEGKKEWIFKKSKPA